ncbi:MAG: oligosaccharide repeat unit polymerase [Hydrogenophaga sp.]|jgi:oligosaccharide repeat unit polymerase|uniref:oligosaccharide repeat unit polymerase n=1 Tax=Hydrogenophaga sp. TaxID=1904254 RepID=UPI0026343727|nr:oligosaccharide repeat unit polymerase [Hydrogenophaga sp.]MCW5668573.1 oligosaccharide repeat unit polymerase [Hydrogenophaga sp.]
MTDLLPLSLILLGFVPLYWRLVGFNLSVTSVFMGAIWLIYGAGYVAFTRFFGPGVFESLLPPNPDNKLAQYLICGRELSQYNFILQTSINLNIIPTFDRAISLLFIGLTLGCMLADRVCSSSPQKMRLAMNEWSAKPPEAIGPTRNWMLTLVSAGALLLLVYFMVHDHQISKVWRYFISQAGEFEKIKMRQSEGGSDSYFFNLMLCTVLPFICFYLIASLKERRGSFLTLALLITLFVALAKLALLSKAPVVVFFAQICLLFQLRKTLRFRGAIVWTFLAALTTLFVMTFVANPELNATQGLGFVLYRIFMAPNEALLEYFAAIPHLIPHTWGLDNRFLAKILQITPLEATHFRVSELYRGVKGHSTNTMFIGDAWAQFGWAGVIAGSALAGFMFRWVDVQMIIVRKKSAASIAGLALAYFAAFTALSTALQTSFLTGGLLMVVPLVWLFSRTRPSSPLVQ